MTWLKLTPLRAAALGVVLLAIAHLMMMYQVRQLQAWRDGYPHVCSQIEQEADGTDRMHMYYPCSASPLPDSATGPRA